MDLSNSSGRGPTGTGTNRPTCDGGTMACTQHRPNVARGGAGGDSSNPSGAADSALSELDRDFIYDIHHPQNYGGQPLSLSQLMHLREAEVRSYEDFKRQFGPFRPSSEAWHQTVIAAYDEEIAKLRSPLGSAIHDLRSLLADPRSKEKDRKDAVSAAIAALRQGQLSGTLRDGDPQITDAWTVIKKTIQHDADEKTAELEDAVRREKASSGSVSDDQFREKIRENMGIERTKQLLGTADDGPSRAMSLVVEVLNLVADRRVKSLRTLISAEKKAPGSVSEQQFTRLVQAVLGDERQKQLLGVVDSTADSMEPVKEVLDIFLERRRKAVNDLFDKQTSGSGVTNAQVDQAIADYDAAKRQAVMLGMSVPNAPDPPDQSFTAKPAESE